MKKTILIGTILLLIGYLLKDEIIYLNLKSTYFVLSYFTISIYLFLIVLFFYLVKLLISKIKSKHS